MFHGPEILDASVLQQSRSRLSIELPSTRVTSPQFAA
jgi:hypothetical protein